MKTVRHLQVPTGDILVVEGEKGLLELVSLGDYGKEANIICEAMGLTRPLEKVEHQEMMPLSKKWVITVSTQYGCRMGCNFCDVPRVKWHGNASYRDIIKQVLAGIKLHPEVETTERMNIHYARMGEPTWNPHVLDATKWLKTHIDPEYTIHPVVSTMMPRDNEWLKTFIHTWMRMKNRLLGGNAGLQISVNSTDEMERFHMFNGNALGLRDISKLMGGIIPSGRKITLNFAIADYTIDAGLLAELFDPDDYICKLTPMHKTATALANEIKTDGDYTSMHPYEKYEKELKEAGFDVIVFIASEEEDASRITCGNAILAGTEPLTDFTEVECYDPDNI